VTKKKKKKLWPLALLLVLALVVWIWWGNTHIQDTVITVKDHRLPESFAGYRIVQVSDLHNEEFGEKQATLLAKTREQAPDIIVVTGDLIDSNHTDIEKAMAFIDGAVDIAPVYYVTGNHEAWAARQYGRLKEEMGEAGVHVLENEAVEIEKGGEKIWLIGIQDPAFADAGADEEAIVDVEIANACAKDMEDAFTILLSHRPECIHTYAKHAVCLALTGHAHGGQVRIPGIGGLIAPDQGLFPKYTAGLYTQGQTQMVVSRGLGNSVLPVRIHNPPELVTIVLAR
jgi:predicted MPP superfamily phosphohydrolase